MNLKANNYSKKRSEVRNFPEVSGVYIFWQRKIPIYVGKAVNLKKRVLSYFSKILLDKTLQMVNSADSISYIKVDNELEALLLEAKLIRSLNPKYNVIQKDDKNPLYIRITKEKYPRVLTARKKGENEKNILFLGPFPSTKNVRSVLKLLRRVFPYSNHRLGKRACIYSQMGLCNPCPSYIQNVKDEKLKQILLNEYLQNIKQIKGVLEGKIKYVRDNLRRLMLKYSKDENFEEAQIIKERIDALDYITSPSPDIEEYLKNPNLYQDLRTKEINSLIKIVGKFIKIDKLTRIECFDVSHLYGSSSTASMVTFINGESEKTLYRHFRIKRAEKMSDTSALEEVIKRRLKHLADWGEPSLVIVDGGKPQVGIFVKYLSKHKIPVVGIAKKKETLVIPVKKYQTNTFIEYVLPQGEAKNLIQRIRNEAHRFAINYHRKLFNKNLLS